jgi:hypothetical protein
MCLFGLSASSQVIQERNSNGADRRLITKLGFRLPQVCNPTTAPDLLNYTGDSAKGGLVYDSCNGKIKWWNGSAWDSSGAGGGAGSIDSMAFHNIISINDTMAIWQRPDLTSDTLVIRGVAGSGTGGIDSMAFHSIIAINDTIAIWQRPDLTSDTLVIRGVAGSGTGGIDSMAFHNIISINDTMAVWQRPDLTRDTLIIRGVSGGGGSIDTTNLSYRIDTLSTTKLNISDTTAMLAPYLLNSDTTSKWISNQFAGQENKDFWVNRGALDSITITGLVDKTDTAAWKPLVGNTDGNVMKFTHWPSSGGQQHLFYDSIVRSFYSTNSIIAANGGSSANMRNIAIGDSSLRNTTSAWNIAIGFRAGQNNTSGSLIAIGTDALRQNTTGFNNVAFGSSALQNNTTGFNNVAFGSSALQNNTTGGDNIAIGSSALSNSNGFNNVAVGSSSLQNNTTGQSNSALGQNSLLSNTAGNNNTSVGVGSANSNTTGSGNSAFGLHSLLNNLTSNFNSAFGAQSLNWNTGSNNSALGQTSLWSIRNGSNNVGVGVNAGGQISLYSDSNRVNTNSWTSVGWDLVADNHVWGPAKVYSHITGNTNILSHPFTPTAGRTYYIAISVTNRTQGSVSATFGGLTILNASSNFNSLSAGTLLTINTNNLIITPSSDFDGTVGFTIRDIYNNLSSNSIFLGAQSKSYTHQQTNEIVIGYEAIGRGSNTTTIGNSSTTSTKLFGRLNIGIVPEHADNAAALAASLVVGDVYRTGDNLKVVH